MAAVSTSRQTLDGLKVLVVEDNFLVAEHLRSILAERGCQVVGPVPRRSDGLTLVCRGEALDGAVLDVQLGSETSFDIASELLGQSIPFLFLTGYGDRAMIPAQFRAAPLLAKPIDEGMLVSAMARLFRSKERPPRGP